MRGERQLPLVVRALHPPGSLAGGLYRRQQKRDENTDDRDHHE
jgi:hypothetical protein